MVLARFLSGYSSGYVDNAGVVGESEAVSQQERDVERCETVISDVLPMCFIDRRQRLVVPLKHTASQSYTADSIFLQQTKLKLEAI